MWLLVVFVLVPMIEIGLFIQVGGWIGLWPTLGLVLAMALLGSWLLRTQGALAFADLRQSLSDFRDPTEPIAHGALILFAGILLITPGFFTDVIGLALLIRPVRRLALRALARRFQLVQVGPSGEGWAGRPESEDIIDGDYTEIDGIPPRQGHSGWTRH